MEQLSALPSLIKPVFLLSHSTMCLWFNYAPIKQIYFKSRNRLIFHCVLPIFTLPNYKTFWKVVKALILNLLLLFLSFWKHLPLTLLSVSGLSKIDLKIRILKNRWNGLSISMLALKLISMVQDVWIRAHKNWRSFAVSLKERNIH